MSLNDGLSETTEELTVSGTGSVTGVATADYGYGIYLLGNMDVSGGEVTASGAQGMYVDGNMTVTGGTVSGTATGEKDDGIYVGGDMTVSGGKVSGSGDDGIYVSGIVTVSGGTVEGTSAGEYRYGIIANDGITVTGGSVTGTATGSSGKGVCTYANMTFSGTGVVTATATGEYGCGVYCSGALTVSGNDTKVTVKGVIYVSDTEGSDYREITNGDGTVTLIPGEYVVSATIGGNMTHYTSLEAAFEAVKNCTESDPAVITLNQDFNLDTAVTVSGGTFTLDQNGHNITGAANTLVLAGSTTNVTFNNSKNGDENYIASTDGIALTVQGGAKATIVDGWIYGDGLFGFGVMLSDGTLTVNGGKISGTFAAINISDNNDKVEPENNIVTINGGTIGDDETERSIMCYGTLTVGPKARLECSSEGKVFNYQGGTIDLSGLSDVPEWRIYNGSGNAVEVSDRDTAKIKLPAHYGVMLDADVIDEMQSSYTYTFAKFPVVATLTKGENTEDYYDLTEALEAAAAAEDSVLTLEKARETVEVTAGKFTLDVNGNCKAITVSGTADVTLTGVPAEGNIYLSGGKATYSDDTAVVITLQGGTLDLSGVTVDTCAATLKNGTEAAYPAEKLILPEEAYLYDEKTKNYVEEITAAATVSLIGSPEAEYEGREFPTVDDAIIAARQKQLSEELTETPVVTLLRDVQQESMKYLGGSAILDLNGNKLTVGEFMIFDLMSYMIEEMLNTGMPMEQLAGLMGVTEERLDQLLAGDLPECKLTLRNGTMLAETVNTIQGTLVVGEKLALTGWLMVGSESYDDSETTPFLDAQLVIDGGQVSGLVYVMPNGEAELKKGSLTVPEEMDMSGYGPVAVDGTEAYPGTVTVANGFRISVPEGVYEFQYYGGVFDLSDCTDSDGWRIVSYAMDYETEAEESMPVEAVKLPEKFYLCDAEGNTVKTSVAYGDYVTITNKACGENAVWDFDSETGKLTITGTGAIWDTKVGEDGGVDTIWNDYYEKIKSIEIGEGITHIGDYAFYNFLNLTEVSLPDSLISIGANAFEACENLEEIALPKNLQKIGAFALSDTGLTSITVPDSVAEIADNAFNDNHTLTRVILPKNNAFTVLADSLFSGCENLKEVTIPASVTHIGNQVFEDSGVTQVNMTGNAPEITVSAFKNAANGLTVYVSGTTAGGYTGGAWDTVDVIYVDQITSVGAIADRTYTGSEQKPEITVTNYLDEELIEGTDYTVSYSPDCINAGNVTVTITGTGAYGGEIEKQFTINQKQLTVTAKGCSKTYGEADPELTYTATGLIGEDKLSGKLTRTEGENVGEYAITQGTLTAGSNYKITFNDGTFDILPKDITKESIGVVKISLPYTGKEQTVELKLPEGAEYDVRGDISATDVGMYEFELTFKGNYYGMVTWGFQITAVAPTCTAPKAKALTYTGEDQPLVIAGATDDGKLVYSLTENGDYTEAVPTAANAGDYKVWYYVQGDANHLDSEPTYVDVTIAKAALTVTAKDTSLTYGEAPASMGITYAGFVNGETDSALSGRMTYAFTYKQYDNVGTYKITPGGVIADNYEITFVDGTLTVNPKDIEVAVVNKSKTYGEADPELTYTATGLIGEDKLSGKLTRTEGENVGEYAITQGTLTAGSNYKITFNDGTFDILPKDITKESIGVVKISLPYTGKEQTVELKLPEGAEYDVRGDISATDVGMYEFELTFKGNYYGTVTWGFQITAVAPTCTAPTAKTLNFIGSEQTLVNPGTTKDGTMVYSLTKDGTYTETIPTGKNVGSYVVWYKVLGDENHTNTVPASLTVTIGGCLHSHNTNVDDGDCTTAVICSVCRKELTPAKETHSWSNWRTTEAATTQQEGKKERACTNSGCTETEQGTIPMLNQVEIPDADGGNVITDNSTPATGDDVTITITPDEGKEILDLVITDEEGNEIEFTANSDGTYTYTQPECDVEIVVTFGDAECPKDDTCAMHSFADLNKDEWYHDGIHYAIESGLMNGVGDGRFDPTGTTTRAMVVTILYRLEGEPAADGNLTFRDVPVGEWYEKAVRWAASEGIVTGYSDLAFGPTDSITREQLATILYRYAQYKGKDTTVGDFKLTAADRDQIPNWAYDGFCWANKAGIITGKEGNLLDPKGIASRAETATVLYRYSLT